MGKTLTLPEMVAVVRVWLAEAANEMDAAAELAEAAMPDSAELAEAAMLDSAEAAAEEMEEMAEAAAEEMDATTEVGTAVAGRGMITGVIGETVTAPVGWLEKAE